MKQINFSFNGGLPLTQDVLGWMQTSVKEMVDGLVKMGYDGLGYPIIISGVVFDGVNWSSGWIYHSGEMIPFVGAAGSFLQITEYRTSVVFEDSNVREIYVRKEATAGAGATPMATLKRFHELFGMNARNAWTSWVTQAVSGIGSLTGNIHYRLNHLANALHFRGSITATDAQAFSSPALYYAIGTALAAEYRPANTTPFTCYVRYHSTNYILELNGTEHITQINAELTNAGALSIGFIKPAAGVTAYTIYWNCMIPLG